MTSFIELGLSEPILKAVSDLGFEKPSEIQLSAIPPLLAGNIDFLGLAQTGTGKTAAFGLPLLEKIDPNSKKIQAVILSPTRELCQQIAGQLEKFSKYIRGVNIISVYGGAPIVGQMKDIKRGGQIVVATPGRLIDLSKRRAINMMDIKFLVLDEADEMLNMGFKEELDTILTYTPEDKNTWLFSATMPNEIRRITHEYMHNPTEVQVKQKEKVNKDIKHFFVTLNKSERVTGLERIIDLHQEIRTIVFCRTRVDTQDVVEKLAKDGYDADYLNGDLSQGQRDKVMKRFKEGRNNVLVATDVAARGIDVNDLSHVIHFNLPDQLEYYTHRSGRTARGGRSGKSIIFCSRSEERKVSQLERVLKISIEKATLPTFDEVRAKKINKWVEKILEEETLDTGPHSIIAEEIVEMLSVLDKEVLIRKFIAKDLRKLLLTKEEKIARKESRRREDRGRDRDRGDRGDRRGNKREGRRGDSNRDRGRSRDNYDKSDRKSSDDNYRDKKKERSSSKKRDDDKKFATYTFDISNKDIANKGHILRILHQHTGLGKKNYGNIDLYAKEIKVEVDVKWEEHFKESVKGLRVNNKKIMIKKT